MGGGKFRLIYSGGKSCALFSVDRVTVYYTLPNSRGGLGKEAAHLIEILFINRKLQPRLPRQNADCLARTIPVFSCAIMHFGISAEYSGNPTKIHPSL